MIRDRIKKALRAAGRQPVRLSRETIASLWRGVQENPHSTPHWYALSDSLLEHSDADRPGGFPEMARIVQAIGAGRQHSNGGNPCMVCGKNPKFWNDNEFSHTYTVAGIPFWFSTHMAHGRHVESSVFVGDRGDGSGHVGHAYIDPDSHDRLVHEIDQRPTRHAKDGHPVRLSIADWFKDSKVAHPDGRPKTVYHGTRHPVDFHEFATDGHLIRGPEDDIEDTGSGGDPGALLGSHFAEEPEVASGFATGTGAAWMKSRYVKPGGAGPRVFPAHLHIRNPKHYASEQEMQSDLYRQNSGHWAVEEAGEATGNPEGFGDLYDNDHEYREDTNRHIHDELKRMDDPSHNEEFAHDLAWRLKQRLIAEGHDGIHYPNAVEGGHSWVAFHPHQIKSAIGARMSMRERLRKAVRMAKESFSQETCGACRRRFYRPDNDPDKRAPLCRRCAEVRDNLSETFKSAQREQYTRDGVTPEDMKSWRLSRSSQPIRFAKGCLMLPITGSAADALKSLAAKIPDDDLINDGRETFFHVTAKYGFTDDIGASDARAILDGPVDLHFGKIDCFENEKEDVVFVSIQSPALRSLNKALSELPNDDKHKRYRPHATLAYTKPGTGRRIAEELEATRWKKRPYTANEAVFSTSEKKKTTIRLPGTKNEVLHADDAGKPEGCICGFPERKLRNGSGHGKSSDGRLCPHHRQWLEEHVWRKPVKSMRDRLRQVIRMAREPVRNAGEGGLFGGIKSAISSAWSKAKMDHAIRRTKDWKPTADYPFPGHSGAARTEEEACLLDTAAVLHGHKPAALVTHEFIKSPAGQEASRRLTAAGHAVGPPNSQSTVAIGRPEHVSELTEHYRNGAYGYESIDHARVGHLLGYPKEAIDKFVNRGDISHPERMAREPVRLLAMKDRPVSMVGSQERINSSNHDTLLKTMRHMLDRIGLRPNNVLPAIHDVSGDARASAVAAVYGESRPFAGEYGTAWQGLIAKQPNLLSFRSHPEGRDSVYRFGFKGPKDVMSQLLDKAGISSRVYVPADDGTHVLIYDLARKFREALGELLSRLGITADEHYGNGEAMGGGDDMGRSDYRDEIRTQEYPERNARAPGKKKFRRNFIKGRFKKAARLMREGKPVKLTGDLFDKPEYGDHVEWKDSHLPMLRSTPVGPEYRRLLGESAMRLRGMHGVHLGRESRKDHESNLRHGDAILANLRGNNSPTTMDLLSEVGIGGIDHRVISNLIHAPDHVHSTRGHWAELSDHLQEHGWPALSRAVSGQPVDNDDGLMRFVDGGSRNSLPVEGSPQLSFAIDPHRSLSSGHLLVQGEGVSDGASKWFHIDNPEHLHAVAGEIQRIGDESAIHHGLDWNPATSRLKPLMDRIKAKHRIGGQPERMARRDKMPAWFTRLKLRIKGPVVRALPNSFRRAGTPVRLSREAIKYLHEAIKKDPLDRAAWKAYADAHREIDMPATADTIELMSDGVPGTTASDWKTLWSTHPAVAAHRAAHPFHASHTIGETPHEAVTDGDRILAVNVHPDHSDVWLGSGSTLHSCPGGGFMPWPAHGLAEVPKEVAHAILVEHHRLPVIRRHPATGPLTQPERMGRDGTPVRLAAGLDFDDLHRLLADHPAEGLEEMAEHAGQHGLHGFADAALHAHDLVRAGHVLHSTQPPLPGGHTGRIGGVPVTVSPNGDGHQVTIHPHYSMKGSPGLQFNVSREMGDQLHLDLGGRPKPVEATPVAQPDRIKEWLRTDRDEPASPPPDVPPAPKTNVVDWDDDSDLPPHLRPKRMSMGDRLRQAVRMAKPAYALGGTQAARPEPQAQKTAYAAIGTPADPFATLEHPDTLRWLTHSRVLPGLMSAIDQPKAPPGLFDSASRSPIGMRFHEYVRGNERKTAHVGTAIDAQGRPLVRLTVQHFETPPKTRPGMDPREVLKGITHHDRVVDRGTYEQVGGDIIKRFGMAKPEVAEPVQMAMPKTRKFRRNFIKGRFKKAARLMRGQPVRMASVEDLHDLVSAHDGEMPTHPEARDPAVQHAIRRTLIDAGQYGLASLAVPHSDPHRAESHKPDLTTRSLAKVTYSPVSWPGKVSVEVHGDQYGLPLYSVHASTHRMIPAVTSVSTDSAQGEFDLFGGTPWKDSESRAIPSDPGKPGSLYWYEKIKKYGPKLHEVPLISHVTRSQKAVAQIVREMLADQALVESEHPEGSERKIIQHLLGPARMERDGEAVKMAKDEALLEGIRQNPHDDAHKLVYADWLRENGEDHLADFTQANLHHFRGRDFQGGMFAALGEQAHPESPANLSQHGLNILSRHLASHEGLPVVGHALSSGEAILGPPPREDAFQDVPIRSPGGYRDGYLGLSISRGYDGHHFITPHVGEERGINTLFRSVMIDPVTAHAALGELSNRPAPVSGSAGRMQRWIEENHPDKVRRIDNTPERMARPKPGIWSLNTIPVTNNPHLGRGEPYYGFVPKEDWLTPSHFRGTELPSNSLAGKERERIEHEEDSTGWVPVTSSWIIGLRRFQGSNAVDFATKDGREYRYPNAPVDLFRRWLGAGSKGRAWHAMVSHYLSPAQKLAGPGGTRLRSAVKRMLTLKRKKTP